MPDRLPFSGRASLLTRGGMEPLGAKGLFEVINGRYGEKLDRDTRTHTPWTRQLYPRITTGPQGEPVEDLIAWTKEHWQDLVLKPAHGYSGHGIFVGYKEDDPGGKIRSALDAGDYIVQQLVPLDLWSELSAWPIQDEQGLSIQEWQTDFRCFITDEGLQGFLARFGGVPTNVGSGGGIQPIAILKSDTPPRKVADKINQALLKLGYKAFTQIQEEINQKAVEMGFTYLLGPIKIMLRPRLLTENHIAELREYAKNLWQDVTALDYSRFLIDLGKEKAEEVRPKHLFCTERRQRYGSS
ncbi:MAG: hypothetical protein JRC68_06345 [Deltaproteobacteria bacterium]|nr:hypothetical protein [Deltaproteobacteria bacterium]